mgnify:CR=1 FL=1
MKRKNHYYKVLQGNYGCGWEDLAQYPATPNGLFADRSIREEAQEDIKAHRDNEPHPFRFVVRRVKVGV